MTDDQDVVNHVAEPDPRDFGKAMKIASKKKWVTVVDEELEALESNGLGR